MSSDAEQGTADANQTPILDTCPLPRDVQTRNAILFGVNTGLIYLAAPVLYVGITQAALCEKLHAKATLANAPSVAMFTLSFVPVLIGWYIPYISWVRRVLVACFAFVAVSLLVVAALFPLNISDDIKIFALIVQGALTGVATTTSVMFLWEVVGRGVAESRRGFAMSLAFGAGPFLAAIGSLLSQLLLSGKMWGIPMPTLEFPWNFTTLFAICAPIMGVAAYLSTLFVIPQPEEELVRKPFLDSIVYGLFDFLSNRVLLTATIVTILAYAGNLIPSNLNLYTEELLGKNASTDYAGYQNALRFSFKGCAGFFLGWLLTKTNPRAGILVTSMFFLTSVCCAIFATKDWYLLTFGIYGAGELVGAYAPNYMLSASPKQNMRRNMSFVMMMMVPSAPFGLLFGWISEHFGKTYNSPAVGFKLSFAACGFFIILSMLIAAIMLPKTPIPPEATPGSS